MVNTERVILDRSAIKHYNILNIVVNTEPGNGAGAGSIDYNILNIVVNTEHII